MEIVKKNDTPEYKQGVVKRKNAELSVIEDFIESPQYQEFFGKLLNDVIDNYTNNILNDESKETYEKLYSMKEVNIRIRKILIALRDKPWVRLKQLEKSIDTMLSTQ